MRKLIDESFILNIRLKTPGDLDSAVQTVFLLIVEATDNATSV